jgi:hypothetical protein
MKSPWDVGSGPKNVKQGNSGNRCSRFDATLDIEGSGCRPLVGLFPSESYTPKAQAPEVLQAVCSSALRYPPNVVKQLAEMIAYHVGSQPNNTPSWLSNIGCLTKDERYTIAWYSSDVRDLGLPEESNWWFVVNQLLRERNLDSLVAHRDGIYYLQSALQKLCSSQAPGSTTSESVTIWRGLKGVRLAELRNVYFQGATVCWPGFTSVSRKQTTMQTFQGGSGGGTMIKLTARGNNIADICRLSLFPGEAECLLGINTIIEVKCSLASDMLAGFPGAEKLPAGVDLVVAEVVETPSFGRFAVKPQMKTPQAIVAGTNGVKQQSAASDAAQLELITATDRPGLVAYLKLHPKSSAAWVKIGRTLAGLGEYVEVNDASYSRRQCFLQAVKNHPSLSEAWIALGETLTTVETVKVNEVAFSKRSCFLEALRHDRKQSVAWMELAPLLGGSETLTIDFPGFTRYHCWLEGLRCNQANATAWFNVATLMTEPQVNVNGFLYSKLRCYVEVLRLDATHAASWFGLSQAMTAAQTVTITQRVYSKKRCLEKCLALGSWTAEAWLEAYSVLTETGSSDTITVNGKKYAQRECLIQALNLDPSNGGAWICLASLTPAGTRSHVAGKDYLFLECFAEALKYETDQDTRASVWDLLAGRLDATGSIVVNGYPHNRRDCSLAALKANPQLSSSWFRLAESLSGLGTVALQGVAYNELQCYAKGLQHERKNFHAWWMVAQLLQPGTDVEVAGYKYSKWQCCVEVLTLHPTFSAGWECLGSSLGNLTAEVNGAKYSTLQCYLQALNYNTRNIGAWGKLIAACCWKMLVWFLKLYVGALLLAIFISLVAVVLSEKTNKPATNHS